MMTTLLFAIANNLHSKNQRYNNLKAWCIFLEHIFFLYFVVYEKCNKCKYQLLEFMVRVHHMVVYILLFYMCTLTLECLIKVRIQINVRGITILHKTFWVLHKKITLFLITKIGKIPKTINARQTLIR